jgi:hypothetical protein
MFRLIKSDIIRRHIESSIKAVLNTQITKYTKMFYGELKKLLIKSITKHCITVCCLFIHYNMINEWKIKYITIKRHN